MKRLVKFFRQYYLFSLAVLAAIIGLVLAVLKLSSPLHWFLAIASICIAIGLGWAMWQEVRSGHYGTDVLAVASTITAVILAQYWAALAVLLVVTSSKLLADWAEHNATNSLKLTVQAPAIRLAERYSLPFTVLAFGIASCAWVITGRSISFLDVLVVATSYPLLWSTPIALGRGLIRAKQNNINAKTGAALEKLAKARTIAFSKTGLLTAGKPMVNKITVYKPFTDEQVLQLAASLEKASTHTVAEAIVAAALEHGLKLTKVKHAIETSGRGIQATIKGQLVAVGQLSYLQELDIELPSRFNPSSIKEIAALVAVDDKLVGLITLKDEVRPEIQAVIDNFQGIGLHTLLITGDSQAAAQTVANSLGITEVYGEMLPADKIHLIEKFKQRPFALVSNNVKDSAALVAADIGIMLGESEAADIVIPSGNINLVTSALTIAKRTFQIARRSMLLGTLLSVGTMLIFASGHFPPLSGAILQAAVNIFAIFYTLQAPLPTANLVMSQE